MSVRVRAGTDASVAFTEKLRPVSSLMASVEGTYKTGAGWVPTLNVAVAVRTRDPLVPVTVAMKDPGVVALQETVALPEPVIVFGVIELHVRLEGTASVRVTVPVKPFCAVTVIVELADWPTVIPLMEVAEIVKSGTGWLVPKMSLIIGAEEA